MPSECLLLVQQPVLQKINKLNKSFSCECNGLQLQSEIVHDKMFQKLKLSKGNLNKKCAPKLLFSNYKTTSDDSDDS